MTGGWPCALAAALAVCVCLCNATAATQGAADPPAATPLAAPQAVSVPSLDMGDGRPLVLPGLWSPATGPDHAPRPAVVLLHGCGGPYARGGAGTATWSAHLTGYAQWLNARGVHALLLDSLSPRGERELCTQRLRDRRVNQLHRRRDALGALHWLATVPGVDAGRLGLMGWSHGGSTALAAFNLRHAEVRAAAVKADFAVAFYPGCSAELQRGFQGSGASLLLLGAADDWTPPGPCMALAAQAGEPRPQARLFDQAYHGFDSAAPVRLRQDVPNGVNPGQGVHVGGHPEARAAALDTLQAFLQAQHLTR
jgi:dienelactone hydrolase